MKRLLFLIILVPVVLNASVTLPEWGGKTIRIMLEQDGFFDGHAFRYIDGRQEEIYPVQR